MTLGVKCRCASVSHLWLHAAPDIPSQERLAMVGAAFLNQATTRSSPISEEPSETPSRHPYKQLHWRWGLGRACPSPATTRSTPLKESGAPQRHYANDPASDLGLERRILVTRCSRKTVHGDLEEDNPHGFGLKKDLCSEMKEKEGDGLLFACVL